MTPMKPLTKGLGKGFRNPKTDFASVPVPVPVPVTAPCTITSNAPAPATAPAVAQLPSIGDDSVSAYVTATGLRQKSGNGVKA